MDVYRPVQDIMRILTEIVCVMSVYSILTNQFISSIDTFENY